MLISSIGFLAFLVPGRHRKYTAIVGWLFIILALFAGLPEFFGENNFLYPVFAALSVPFFRHYGKISPERGREGTEPVAGGCCRIPRLCAIRVYTGDGELAHLPGSQRDRLAPRPAPCYNHTRHWNVIMRNSFRVEIILACTGIESIAIMLGVAAAVPTTLRQKIGAFLLVAPTIYFLNLLRNVFVVIAYTDQWFPYYPQIAGNGEIGYESFFWAHNVIAELLALVVLVFIAFGLFTFIPRLATFADELYQLYFGEIQTAFAGIKPAKISGITISGTGILPATRISGYPVSDQDKIQIPIL